MDSGDDEFFRATLSRTLAQRDIIEFLLAAYLDTKPKEAREVLIAILSKDNQPIQAAPLSDLAAEVWADISVRRNEERRQIVQRAREFQERMDRAGDPSPG